MTAAQLRAQDQDLRARAERAELRVRELELALERHRPPEGGRRDTRRGTGWVISARIPHECHRCPVRIPRGATYYRTTHKRKNGEILKVCYCRSCAMVLGHGQPKTATRSTGEEQTMVENSSRTGPTPPQPERLGW